MEESTDKYGTLLKELSSLGKALRCLELPDFMDYYKTEYSNLSGMTEFVDFIRTEKVSSENILFQRMQFMLLIEDERRIVPAKQDAVTLITAHECKGKEYPVVFVYGIETEFATDKMSDEETEEVRRLLYVAMTRAKEELILCKSTNKKSMVDGLTKGGIHSD